jgi:hypothetical protein
MKRKVFMILNPRYRKRPPCEFALHSYEIATSYLLAMTRKKEARKSPTENRAGSWPCGQKVFSVLIFCYFSIRRKVVAPAAMSGRKHFIKTEILPNPGAQHFESLL